MSYLPLSYITAQIFDMWVAISVAGTLYFAPPEAGRTGVVPRPPGAVSAARARLAGREGSLGRGSAPTEILTLPPGCAASALPLPGPQFSCVQGTGGGADVNQRHWA